MRTQSVFFLVLRAFIALAYMALGFVFVFSKVSHQLLPAEVAPYFGGALLLYGGFRLYRAWLARPQAS